MLSRKIWRNYGTFLRCLENPEQQGLSGLTGSHEAVGMFGRSAGVLIDFRAQEVVNLSEVLDIHKPVRYP